MKSALFASLVVLSLAACTMDDKSITAPVAVVHVPVVTTISISPVATQLEIGRTATLIGVARSQLDSVMPGIVLTWSSTNPAVATVAAGGVVTAISKGTTTITAAAGAKTGSATVFVVDPSVATVTIAATVPSLFYVGQTLQAVAVAKDAGGNTLTAFITTWTSSNTAVATVSSTGLITAAAAGTATVTASTSGKTGSVSVTVSLVPVTSVTLSTAKAVKIGRTMQVTSVLKNSTGGTLTSDQRSFVWATTDSTVATVSAAGVLTGLAAGTTVISCIIENKLGLLTVVVSEVAIDRVVVTPDSSSVVVGATKQLSATAFDADSVTVSVPALNGRTFVWSSSAVAKAVISSTGLVTAVATGTANMTATLEVLSGLVGVKSGVGVITIP